MIWETVRAFEAHWMSPDDLRFEFEKAEGEMRGKIKRMKPRGCVQFL